MRNQILSQELEGHQINWTERLRGDLKSFVNITLAPLTPQFWGETTLVFGFLPPELGGGGANAGINETFKTVSELVNFHV
jgi:hypothetical protein